MRQALLIFNKEFRDYFASPIAYIVIAIFLALMGLLFFLRFFYDNVADLRGFFNLLPYFFAIIVPLITMRLFSEELNVGSYELLLTLPVSFRDVIIGKFLAAVAFVAAIILPTLAYPIFISFIGDLDWGRTIGGYIGALLLGASYAAIGLFTSSLTRNQIVAGIVAMLICMILSLIHFLAIVFPQQIVDLITFISANAHFANIAKGILDSRDLLYFLSIVFLGLYATHMVMEEK